MGNVLTREDKNYNDLKLSLNELKIGLEILKSVKEKMIEEEHLDSNWLNKEITNIESKIREINDEINAFQEVWRRRKDEEMESMTEYMML